MTVSLVSAAAAVADAGSVLDELPAVAVLALLASWTDAGWVERATASLPAWAYQLIPHTIISLFVFAFGACLGSFVNVLVYRLPAGISVVSPPSRCPICGVRLGWQENLPVLGWFLLGGRCRACAARISFHYPGVELLVASLCTLLYLAYFMSSAHTPWWGEVGGAWFSAVGPLRASPLLALHCMLLAALVAMTLIDARLAIVTMEIPVTLTIIAIIVWPLQGWLALTGPRLAELPLPLPDWPWLLAALGAGVGLLIANVLLRRGVIPGEFEEFELDLAAPLPPMVWTLLVAPAALGLIGGGFVTGRAWMVGAGAVVLAGALIVGAVATRRLWVRLLAGGADDAEPGSSRSDTAVGSGAHAAMTGDFGPPPRDYASALATVRRELLFLAPLLFGAAIGFGLGMLAAAVVDGPPPVPLACLGGSLLGYLAGAGVIWAIRLAGTAGFGREAMGLGDVHLLGAVGAVLGWIDPIGAVILATASGIGWAIVTALLLRRWGGMGSAMPFGPHLAVGCMLVIALRPALSDFWRLLTMSPPPG